jgi:hypothetical protein
VSKNQVASIWTDELRAEVSELWKTLSGKEISALLQERGIVATRNSILGLMYRMSLTEADKEIVRRRRTTDPSLVDTRQKYHKRLSERRREQRWAANPDLKVKYELQKQNRALMLAGGATRTSVAFRRHLPRLGDMTKTELRAMLSAAVQNTAAMAVPA